MRQWAESTPLMVKGAAHCHKQLTKEDMRYLIPLLLLSLNAFTFELYTLNGNTFKWGKTTLTYAVSAELAAHQTNVRQAFFAWNEAAQGGLNMVEAESFESADITFVAKDLGSTDPKRLAQCIISYKGTLLTQARIEVRPDLVADINFVRLTNLYIHEIGHALGLKHSSLAVPEYFPSVMNPTVNSRVYVKLNADDVAGLWTLYPPSLTPPSLFKIKATGRSITIKILNMGVTNVLKFGNEPWSIGVDKRGLMAKKYVRRYKVGNVDSFTLLVFNEVDKVKAYSVVILPKGRIELKQIHFEDPFDGIIKNESAN